MPLSTAEHAEAFIAQFKKALEDKERELLDMRDTLAAMERAPKYLKGAVIAQAAEKVVTPGLAHWRTGTLQLSPATVSLSLTSTTRKSTLTR